MFTDLSIYPYGGTVFLDVFIFGQITIFPSGTVFNQNEQFSAVSKITGTKTNVPTAILVYGDFLVTYPKNAENGPSKLVFGLVSILRSFWSPVGQTALKMVFIYLIW